jgi:hypothetical protein
MGSGIEATRELVIASLHLKWRPRVLVSTVGQLTDAKWTLLEAAFLTTVVWAPCP